LSTKYKILSEENAPLILDLEAERSRIEEDRKSASRVESEEDVDDEFSHLDLTRKKSYIIQRNYNLNLITLSLFLTQSFKG